MNNKLHFIVRGSAAEPYHLIFHCDAGAIKASCSCPAGRMAALCKHRLAILRGDPTGLVEPNQFDINTLARWLSGSQVEQELHALTNAEEALKYADAELKSVKKRLSILLRD